VTPPPVETPVADLAALLALPQTAITKGGKAPTDRAIGSGPFVLDSLDRGKRRLAVRAFDDHFAGRPYLDRLVLHWYDKSDGEARAFETDGTQLSARGVTAFASALPKFRAEDVESAAALLAFVGFGRAHRAVTDEPAFRQALDLALSRRGLTAVTSGERVVPMREPVPIEAGGAALAAAQLDGDVAAAKASLAAAAQRVVALRAIPRLDILVDDSRPDDLLLAERVATALADIGVSVTSPTLVPANVLRDRVAAGTCDLWIGQLAEPVMSPLAWWAAAFAAGNDTALVPAIAAGTFDVKQARAAFAARPPIVPLMFRSLRLWHRTDVRGLGFDASGRPGFADLFLFGAPVRAKKPSP
jgi:ABC-type transport system substrate-binding protein